MKHIKCAILSYPVSDLILGALSQANECDEQMIQKWEQENIPLGTNNKDEVDNRNVRTESYSTVKKSNIILRGWGGGNSCMLKQSKTQITDPLSVYWHRQAAQLQININSDINNQMQATKVSKPNIKACKHVTKDKPNISAIAIFWTLIALIPIYAKMIYTVILDNKTKL